MRREQIEATAEQIAAEIVKLENMLSTQAIRHEIEQLYAELDQLGYEHMYTPPRHKRT